MKKQIITIAFLFLTLTNFGQDIKTKTNHGHIYIAPISTLSLVSNAGIEFGFVTSKTSVRSGMLALDIGIKIRGLGINIGHAFYNYHRSNEISTVPQLMLIYYPSIQKNSSFFGFELGYVKTNYIEAEWREYTSRNSGFGIDRTTHEWTQVGEGYEEALSIKIVHGRISIKDKKKIREIEYGGAFKVGRQDSKSTLTCFGFLPTIRFKFGRFVK